MTGEQPFMLSQHTINVQKVLAACDARHAISIGGGAAPLLADAKTLTASDGATTLPTLTAAQRMITHLRVVTATIFDVGQGTTSDAGNFANDMVARKDELDNSMAWDARRGRKIPGLILCGYQILWKYWVNKQ